jgi:hydroxyacylglutathione hydrolase
MKIITLQVGSIQTNCYILCDEASHKAAIIDPGANEQRILEQLQKTGCIAEFIILTHGHFDHTAAAAELLAATGAKLVAHQLEAEIIGSAALSMHTMFTSKPYKPLVTDIFVSEGDSLPLGSLVLKFIHTPGHTQGGCCIICGDNIFCGDTVFRENIGRTDLPTANRIEMSRSVKRIAAIDGDYKLYPGHGEPTTLSHERENNPYMR